MLGKEENIPPAGGNLPPVAGFDTASRPRKIQQSVLRPGVEPEGERLPVRQVCCMVYSPDTSESCRHRLSSSMPPFTPFFFLYDTQIPPFCIPFFQQQPALPPLRFSSVFSL